MASAEDILLLQEYAREPLEVTPRDDVALNDIIDAAGSVEAAAQRLWRSYAASLSGLVDIAESGSSRKQGDLYKNALVIANSYQPVVTRVGPRSHAIVRGDVAT